MFLSEKYVLANELVQKMGIHIANISMLRSAYEEDDDFTTMLKMNNCTFINTKSHKLPSNIRVGLSSHQFTSMTDKLPVTYVKTEFEATEKELFKSGIVINNINVAGKDFYVFAPDFVQKMRNKVPYILDEKETTECMSKNQILGFIKLSKNKYFTWY